MGTLGADEIFGSCVGEGWQKAVGFAGKAIAVPQNPRFANDASPLGVAGVASDQRRIVPSIDYEV